MQKIGEVFVTENYDLFTMIDNNRRVDPFNVTKIVDSMKEKFLITIALIIRKDDQLVVLDGQHRLAACRYLKKPFYYCIVDDLEANTKVDVTVKTLPALQNTKKWVPSDYVNFYSVGGKQDYQVLQNFMEETDLPTIASHICLTGLTGVALPTNFKRGGFKVRNEERGYALAKIVNRFKDAGMHGASNPLFVSALFKGLMRHTINLKKCFNAAEQKLPVINRWVGSSVTSTLLNLEAYSHTDRGLSKQHIDFKNQEWPYQINQDQP